MQAKPRDGVKQPSLIDLDAINEMIEFEDFLLSIVAPLPKKATSVDQLTLYNICVQKEMVDKET